MKEKIGAASGKGHNQTTTTEEQNEPPQVDKSLLNNHFSNRILNRKTIIIGLRLSPRENEAVRALARAEGKDLSHFIRETILRTEAAK